MKQPTVTLTLEQLKSLCVDAMRDALFHDERDAAIASALAEADSLPRDIAAAERGETAGRHALAADIIVHRFNRSVCRPADSPQFPVSDPPERYLKLVQAAQQHLAVDLSEFRSPPLLSSFFLDGHLCPHL